MVRTAGSASQAKSSATSLRSLPIRCSLAGRNTARALKPDVEADVSQKRSGDELIDHPRIVPLGEAAARSWRRGETAFLDMSRVQHVSLHLGGIGCGLGSAHRRLLRTDRFPTPQE